ncbi:UNVERIFIED_CONTAM: hypothetical protein NCL1_36391 [Trichonephila clavipes]
MSMYLLQFFIIYALSETTFGKPNIILLVADDLVRIFFLVFYVIFLRTVSMNYFSIKQKSILCIYCY